MIHIKLNFCLVFSLEIKLVKIFILYINTSLKHNTSGIVRLQSVEGTILLPCNLLLHLSQFSYEEESLIPGQCLAIDSAPPLPHREGYAWVTVELAGKGLHCHRGQVSRYLVNSISAQCPPALALSHYQMPSCKYSIFISNLIASQDV